MAEISVNLERVLNRWSDDEQGPYDRQTRLGDIWSEKHPGDVPAYIPNGARDLRRTIKKDAFYGPCPSAHDLTIGRLAPGGDVQSVGDLADFLFLCDEKILSGKANL